MGRKLCQNAHIGFLRRLDTNPRQELTYHVSSHAYLGKLYLHLTSVHHGLVGVTSIQLEAKLYQRQLDVIPTKFMQISHAFQLQATAKKGLVDILPFGVTAVAALDKLNPSTFADGSMLDEVKSP